MKKIQKLALTLMAVLTLMGLGSQSAQAGGPLRFAVKAGMQVNSLKLNEDVFSSSNREGFTGGVGLQFIAPLLNIGVDASAMYTHRQNRIYYDGGEGTNIHSDYIEIPVNFRWNIGLPVVGKVITPVLQTGPDFSFLLSKANVKNAWDHKTFDFAWNFGAGLKFFDKLELAASYGLGISNAASGSNASLYGNNIVNGKNRFWTVTAAWLF